MLIRLVIADSDTRFSQKFSSYLNAHYINDFMLALENSKEELIHALEREKSDIVLAEPELWDDTIILPKGTQLVFYTHEPDVASWNGFPTVYKFQSAEELITELRYYYDSIHQEAIRYQKKNGSAKLVAFVGAGGGVGTTVAAVGCAIEMALRHKKVLYLDLQAYGTSDMFFDNASGNTMSDVLFAANNNMKNLSVQLEKYYSSDSSGVWYFLPYKNAVDACDMTPVVLERILQELMRSDRLEYIIADVGSGNFELQNVLAIAADRVVWCGRDTESGQKKLNAAIQMQRDLDEIDMTNVIPKSVVFLNYCADMQKARLHQLCGVDMAGVFQPVAREATEIARIIAANGFFGHLI